MTRRGTWFVVVCLAMLVSSCREERVTDTASDGHVTVTGRLVAVKDDRPVDGGIDLTVETEQGQREVLRVGSAFIAGPREEVLALHRVVDAAKVGDRLRATGHRDESGALIVERLEIIH